MRPVPHNVDCQAVKMNTHMKRARLISFLLVLFVGLISVGCRSISTNEAKATQTVREWVPAGTSLEDATKIFQQHGFTNNPTSTTYWSHNAADVAFDKKGPVHYWGVLVHMENGKTTTNITVKVLLTALLHMKT
jgi:hypothetical protein